MVVVNGQRVPPEVFQEVFQEVNSRRFRYIEKAKTAKTEGVREANRKKVHRLDEIMSLLEYATGVSMRTVRKPWR